MSRIYTEVFYEREEKFYNSCSAAEKEKGPGVFVGEWPGSVKPVDFL